MIKSLIRRGTLIGMVGTAILGASLSNLKALALPAEEIMQVLNPVPVFTIANEEGIPLVATVEDDVKVTGIYFSQQDANEMVSRLQSQDPDLASQVQVVPVSLGKVYQLAQDNLDNENLKFNLVPNETAVSDAKTVPGTQYQGGVPLFVAKVGEDDGYLTIEQNSQKVIPFFFEKQQLESMVEQFKTQEPDATVNIEVIPLENIIQTLQSNDTPELKIVLIPSTESIQFLQQSATEQPGTPAPAPAPTPAPAE